MKRLVLSILAAGLLSACGAINLRDSEHKIIHTMDFEGLRNFVAYVCEGKNNPNACRQRMIENLFRFAQMQSETDEDGE